MPIRHTGVVNRLGWAVLLAGLAVSACARTDGGTAVRAAETPTPLSSQSASPSASADPTSTSDVPESSQPGVVETTRHPVQPQAVPCSPPPSAVASQTTDAATADPNAPRITLAVPRGWSAQSGSGDVATRLTGPDGMVGDVTIAVTQLDAAAAFTRYADDVMAKYPISSLSALPAELCGYSGQKLMGNWADSPDRSIQYNDRIVHIWTNDKDYLVAVHVQAPSGTAGFEEAASVLTDDFGVSIP